VSSRQLYQSTHKRTAADQSIDSAGPLIAHPFADRGVI